MKQFLALLLISLVGLSVCYRHLKSNAKSKVKKSHKHDPRDLGPVFYDSPPHANTHTPKLPDPKPIKVIPFGPAAQYENPEIDSVGEEVSEAVVLDRFPFKVTRCDQIVIFPSTYINDEDDFRVRRKGFVAITAYYTNLFDDKDGQKLIQQVLSSTARAEPFHLKGARGCVRVPGDLRQKNLNICTSSMNNAKNLLEVYVDFARCRLGDNLAPISSDVLRELMKMCNINRVTITGKGAEAAMDKLEEQLEERNERMAEKLASRLNGESPKPKEEGEMTDAQKKALMNKYLKKRKRKLPPQFFLPTVYDNPWEEDRRKYVQYHRLKVPGSRRR